jgi:hypothetical protein
MGWLFEEKETSLLATQMLLVRICVGKIEKLDKAKEILRGVPVREEQHCSSSSCLQATKKFDSCNYEKAIDPGIINGRGAVVHHKYLRLSR